MTTKTKADLLQWPRRPTRYVHDFLGPRQFWTSRCGQFRVERFVKYDRRYLAMRREALMGGIWTIVSRHYKLGPAQQACELRARRAAKAVNGEHHGA